MAQTATDAPTDATPSPYGPSLPQLLGPRLRALSGWQRGLLALVAAAVVLAVVLLALRGQASVETYRQSEADARARGLPAIPFHFDHSERMRIEKPSGSYVLAERTLDGTISGSFRVTPFRLEPEPGLLSGFMPVVATRFEREAARRYENFRLVFEGRARVNEVEGYQFAFTAQLARPGKPPRQLFGRIVMLPEPYDASDPEVDYPAGEGPTRGLMITMLATTLDNVPSATRVGDEGILQRPFRSFRFGDG